MLMITKEMTVGQVLRSYPQTVQTFLQLGMHCLGCPSSTMESIEGAALTHGKKPDELVEQLNKAIQAS
jgi:hybrid cluster-associated redox disulfide protein